MIWRDPGQVESLDFANGPGGRGGRPAPPFRFVKENSQGAYPKVEVRDARGRAWSVKFGREVKSEPFVAWAAGYYVQPVHYVARGVIGGAHDLKRTGAHIGPDGRFENARFQLRDPNIRFMDDRNWSWSYNPFQGTKELNGLKVVMLLVSNWDNKDARDQDRGPNTAIFENRRSSPRYIYAFTDWGATMGNWGNVARRNIWNCEAFADDK